MKPFPWKLLSPAVQYHTWGRGPLSEWGYSDAPPNSNYAPLSSARTAAKPIFCIQPQKLVETHAVGKLLHLPWRSKRLKRKRPGSKFTNRQMCFSSRVVGCVFERRQETVRPIYAVCREPISSAPKHIIQDCIVLQRFVFLQKGALYTKKHCIQSWECFCGFELYSAPSD